MADNIPVTPGSGASIATDEVTTRNGASVAPEHAQRVKAGWGADGAFNDVSPEQPMPVSDDGYGLPGRLPLAVEVSALGDNTVLTPASGNAIRFYWIGLSTSETNTGEVLVIVKFGADGDAIYRWNLGAPGAFTHREMHDGPPDTPLIVNLSAAGRPVQANLTYREV